MTDADSGTAASEADAGFKPAAYKTRYLSADTDAETLQFIFHLIAPAYFKAHHFESNKAYFRSIAGISYELPNKTVRSFSVETLERYLRRYKAGNIDALQRKQRSDKGISRKLSLQAEIRIGEIMEEVPVSTTTSVAARLKKEKVIEEGECSVDTIRRYIDAHDLRNIPVGTEKLRNSFLVPHFGDLFVADTLYYEKLGQPVAGKKTPWVYVQGIIDDHSRLMLATETYTEDTALNFQFTLRKAISLFGIPERLYVDRGAPYCNNDLTAICNRLGIDLIHAQPYDGAAKGVVESKWKVLLNESRVDIVLDNLTTQEQLDARVQEWRCDYNKRKNSGVGGIPIERYKASLDEKPVRRVASQEELSKAFSLERVRTLDNLGIIHLAGVKYKAPDELRVLVKGRPKMKVVYDPMDMDGTIHVAYNGKDYPLTVDDPMETGRKNARKALERAREVKSCTGMSAAEIRAENRYRERMAGTNRVPSEKDDNKTGEPVASVEAGTDTIPVPTEVPEQATFSADNNASAAPLVEEETLGETPFVYTEEE